MAKCKWIINETGLRCGKDATVSVYEPAYEGYDTEEFKRTGKIINKHKKAAIDKDYANSKKVAPKNDFYQAYLDHKKASKVQANRSIRAGKMELKDSAKYHKQKSEFHNRAAEIYARADQHGHDVHPEDVVWERQTK